MKSDLFTIQAHFLEHIDSFQYEELLIKKINKHRIRSRIFSMIHVQNKQCIDVQHNDDLDVCNPINLINQRVRIVCSVSENSFSSSPI